MPNNPHHHRTAPPSDIIEPLDSSAMWGVFRADDYSPTPLAMFDNRECCDWYIERVQGQSCLSAEDLCVMPVWVESGEVGNHGEEVLAVGALEGRHDARWPRSFHGTDIDDEESDDEQDG